MLKRLFPRKGKKEVTGEQKIVNLTNALTNEIIKQGYKLKDETGVGALFIFLHSDGTMAIENTDSGLDVKGEQEAEE